MHPTGTLGRYSEKQSEQQTESQPMSSLEAKCAEDALKQAVKRFYWPTGKVSGPDSGDLGCHRDFGGETDQ